MPGFFANLALAADRQSPTNFMNALRKKQGVPQLGNAVGDMQNFLDANTPAKFGGRQGVVAEMQRRAGDPATNLTGVPSASQEMGLNENTPAEIARKKRLNSITGSFANSALGFF